MAQAAPASARTTNAAAFSLSDTESPTDADPDVIFDDDGNVVEGDDESVTVPWEGVDSSAPDDDPAGEQTPDDLPVVKPPKSDDPPVTVQSCPEVNDKPTYKLTKSRKFITDKEDPWSTWLLPDQTVSYTTESSHEFGVTVTVGVSAEAGAFLVKAASKLDVAVSYKYTSKKGRTISDTNKTKKGYRVRLGNQGFRVVEKKTWIVPPCKVKTKVTWDLIAPEKGDLSFGRFKS
jgi:hypothetical protein